MSFSDEIAKFAKKATSAGDFIVRDAMFKIMKSIDDRSPVGNPTGGGKGGVPPWKSAPPIGYVGGHFRANWQLGIGTMPTGEIPGTAHEGALEKEQAKIPTKAAGKVYYYANNVPYAQVLEDGHSLQAPYGMVGLTKIQFQDIINRIAGGLK